MFTDLVTGDVPGASTYFNPLMRQTVIPCTSGSRPTGPHEGMTIYETDTNRHAKYTGTVWEYIGATRVTGYSPALFGSTTNPTLGTGSVQNGHYTYTSGASIMYTFFIKFGTSGTSAGSGNYQVALPVTSALPFGSTNHSSVGVLQLANGGASTFAVGSCFVDPTNPDRLGMIFVASASAGVVSNTAPFAWGASMYLSGSIVYPI